MIFFSWIIIVWRRYLNYEEMVRYRSVSFHRRSCLSWFACQPSERKITSIWFQGKVPSSDNKSRLSVLQLFIIPTDDMDVNNLKKDKDLKIKKFVNFSHPSRITIFIDFFSGLLRFSYCSIVEYSLSSIYFSQKSFPEKSNQIGETPSIQILCTIDGAISLDWTEFSFNRIVLFTYFSAILNVTIQIVSVTACIRYKLYK